MNNPHMNSHIFCHTINFDEHKKAWSKSYFIHKSTFSYLPQRYIEFIEPYQGTKVAYFKLTPLQGKHNFVLQKINKRSKGSHLLVSIGAFQVWAVIKLFLEISKFKEITWKKKKKNWWNFRSLLQPIHQHKMSIQ